MRIPPELTTLFDHGMISEVVRPLLSGKEAQVYLVISDDEERVAKVYKDAAQRSFRQRAVYAEGRKVRNSRDRRALSKGSRYGKKKEEAAWRTAEVDMMYRLQAAGVRVPKPYYFLDGVLIMEMITDPFGSPAPRLGELDLPEEAVEWIFEALIAEVVKMLCAGVVHGDLSDFNVLMTQDGPVIIDFPQTLDAAGNQSARKILIRDVANLNKYLTDRVDTNRPLRHAEEMWDLYARGELQPDTVLTGHFHRGRDAVNVQELLDVVQEAEGDAMARLAGQED